MPKNDSSIQFSLSKQIRDELANISLVTGRDEQGNETKESLGQTAKRLVIAALGIEATERAINRHSTNTDLLNRIATIEYRLDWIEDYLTPDWNKEDHDDCPDDRHHLPPDQFIGFRSPDSPGDRPDDRPAEVSPDSPRDRPDDRLAEVSPDSPDTAMLIPPVKRVPKKGDLVIHRYSPEHYAKRAKIVSYKAGDYCDVEYVDHCGAESSTKLTYALKIENLIYVSREKFDSLESLVDKHGDLPKNLPLIPESLALIAPTDAYVVCHLSLERAILAYWGGKAGWVRDRADALIFNTESKAKAQITRSKKKYPELDIRYNSIAVLEKLESKK
jgi:hypothetical protein